MKHNKFSYVYTWVSRSQRPVLLTGSAGTGKSTLAMQLAEELNLTFHSISCTKQMSVNALLGFISINGVYIPTQFRQAFEHGGLFLLDEIDAADPNVLLTLNTIENGFISFPDGIIDAHPSFRLIATANPFNEHSIYTGRSKLDFSTIDRFFVVELERDPDLELSLTSQEIVDNITIARQLLSDHGITSTVTMRDAIRLYELSQFDISDCIYHDVVFKRHPDLYDTFKSKITIKAEEVRKASMTQADVKSIDELWEVISQLKSNYQVGVDYDSTTRNYTSFEAHAYNLCYKFIESNGNIQAPTDWSVTKQMSPETMRYQYTVKQRSTGRTITFKESDFTETKFKQEYHQERSPTDDDFPF